MLSLISWINRTRLEFFRNLKPSVRDHRKVTVHQRQRIRISAAEPATFVLPCHGTMAVARLRPSGYPDLMPIQYNVDADGRPATWIYANSQKTRNLERDPRATLLVEDGFDYADLGGAILEADMEIVRDPTVAEMSFKVVDGYARAVEPPCAPSDAMRAHVAAQASKRGGLPFALTGPVTWGHCKLRETVPGD